MNCGWEGKKRQKFHHIVIHVVKNKLPEVLEGDASLLFCFFGS